MTWSGDVVAAERFGTPEEIRAALPLGQREEFDAAVARARTDQQSEVLRMWRRQALLATRDPEAHRRMLEAAAEIERTGRPRRDSVAWRALKAELGL